MTRLRPLTLAAIAVLLVSCSSRSSSSEPVVHDGPPPSCELPWESMEQVEACGSSDYETASIEGTEVNIVIEAEDPDAIAAALAHAFVANSGMADEIVVWGWSSADVIGTGWDRGVVSEQGELGELLVFEVCTAWSEPSDIGVICEDQIDFTIEQ